MNLRVDECSPNGSSEKLYFASKFLNVRMGTLQDLSRAKWVAPEWVASALQLGDGFTKPLARLKFEQWRTMIGVCAPS